MAYEIPEDQYDEIIKNLDFRERHGYTRTVAKITLSSIGIPRYVDGKNMREKICIVGIKFDIYRFQCITRKYVGYPPGDVKITNLAIFTPLLVIPTTTQVDCIIMFGE